MASVLSGLLFGEEAGEDSVASHSSGYGGSGHSGSGIDRSGHRHSGHSGGGHGHSGGGHGGHSGGYGGHSGGFSGHSGHSGHGKDECCPLVVDAICLAAILLSVAGASFLLARVIQIEIMVGRKKKRKRKRSVLPSVSQSFTQFLYEGKSHLKDLHLHKSCLNFLHDGVQYWPILLYISTACRRERRVREREMGVPIFLPVMISG